MSEILINNVGLLPATGIVLVVLAVQLVKYLEGKYLNLLSERGKDVVYTLMAPLLVFVLAFFGLIKVDDVNTLLPLLLAPNGVYVFVKKLLSK